MQQASNSDMALVHDHDLGFIGGAASLFPYLSYHHTQAHPVAAAGRDIDRTRQESRASDTAGSVW